MRIFILFHVITDSFFRLRAPSYFCDNETEQGLHLHYRSKRRGFTHYTMGQLKAIAQTFFNLKLDIEVMDSEIVFDTIHVSFKVLVNIICTSNQVYLLKLIWIKMKNDCPLKNSSFLAHFRQHSKV